MCVRVALPKLGGDRPLGLAVAEREEERDGDRLGIDVGQRVEVEGNELARGPGSSSDADAALERNERGRMLDARAVQVSPRLPSQVEDVLEALVRDERSARAPPLEQGVRGDRRPVREALHAFGTRGLGRRDDGLVLARARRHLRHPYAPVGQEDGVGERPADVDSQRAHGRIRTRMRE